VQLRSWPKPSVEVAAGQTSAWVEVGGTMDTLNDGQWNWRADGAYTVEFGLRTSIGADGSPRIEPIATFDGSGALPLAADADTRYTRRLRHQQRVPGELLDYLDNHPTRGRLPSETLIYGYTFQPGMGDAYDGAVRRFREMFALTDTRRSLFDADRPRGYIDVRGVPTTKLAEHCRMLGDDAARIACVSLGDEIALPKPRGKAANEGFVAWLKQQRLAPNDVDPSAGGDWSKIAYAPDDALRDTKPGLFYWSRRYAYHHGIRAIKQRTDILREHLPNAHIGANFSPHYPTDHAYLGEVHKWVSVFRAGGMTMPWSEDYIWQMPVATPQVNHISLDLFRAGLRHHPGRPIHFYVMPHAPNNTPRQWRRLFYGAVAHGARIFNLFEFRPVHAAYTENHVDDPAMYLTVRTAFRELGTFEQILQGGRVRSAQAALWFSETGDIWGDSAGSFAAAKRTLYTAIRHHQAPLDVVVEVDAIDGTLDDYRVLYLTDAHVSRAASQAIAAWVRRGGRLFATAGAGMFDEVNRPNRTLRELMGVQQTALEAPADRQIKFIKQDLPFSEPIDALRPVDADAATSSVPVIAVRSVIDVADGVEVRRTFTDGKPAVTRRVVGKGEVTCCAFLPGLSYYHPAVPRRPVDRGATDDAFVHFLPTDFHPNAAALIAQPLDAVERPVVCSEPLVESTVIESPHGTLVPLVNWTGEPVSNLSVKLRLPEAKEVSLASGGGVKVRRVDDRTIVTLDLAADADALVVR